MKKAPSRLTNPAPTGDKIQTSKDLSVVKGKSPTSTVNDLTVSTSAIDVQSKLKNWFFKYSQFLPWLVGAGFFYLLSYLLMANIEPRSIANFPLPDAYLPFQILVAGGNLMLATFLWQNQWRGLWTMFFLNGLLFLKLQKFELSPMMILMWSGPWLILIAWSFKRKR